MWRGAEELGILVVGFVECICSNCKLYLSKYNISVSVLSGSNRLDIRATCTCTNSQLSEIHMMCTIIWNMTCSIYDITECIIPAPLLFPFTLSQKFCDRICAKSWEFVRFSRFSVFPFGWCPDIPHMMPQTCSRWCPRHAPDDLPDMPQSGAPRWSPRHAPNDAPDIPQTCPDDAPGIPHLGQLLLPLQPFPPKINILKSVVQHSSNPV